MPPRAAARDVVSPCRALSDTGGPAVEHGLLLLYGGPAFAGWTLARSDTHPAFLAAFCGLSVHRARQLSGSLHQLAFAVDVGFDKLYAAGVLGIGSFLAIPGTILTGTLSDYIGREWSAILAYGFSIFGVVCALLITSPDQHWLLWLHACFFGLTWGARGPAITAKTADLFPGASSARFLA